MVPKSEEVIKKSHLAMTIYTLRVMISSLLLLIGGVHIAVRVLLGINLKWFGCIPRLSQWGRGYFTHSDDFYLPLLRL